MSLVKKLAGETLIYGLSNIIPRILHFAVFTSYLTYKFDDQGNFGIYTDLYAYATILLVLFSYRMDTAFFRFGSREFSISKAFNTALIPLIFSSILFVSLLFVFSDSIADALKYPGQSYYVQWFALIIAFDALALLPYAKFRLQQRPLRFTFFKVFNTIITIILVLFFLELCPILYERQSFGIHQWFNPDRLLDYVFLSNLIASALILALMLPEYRQISLNWDYKLWRKMFKYALPLVIVGIAGNFNQAFAVPLQKYFLGSDYQANLTSGGIYAAPAKLALLLNLFAVAFNYAAEPFFFRNFKHQDAKIIYGQVCKVFTIAAIIVLSGIILYLDILKYIIGPEYHEALHIVPILLCAYLCLGLYYNFSIWYKLVDKTHYGAFISVGGAIITLVISIYFLPRIGYIASAWAALACYSFMCILGYWTGQYHYPIKYPLRSILVYIGFALIIAVAHQFLMNQIDSSAIKFFISTALFLGLIGFIYVKDGAYLKSVFSGTQRNEET